MLNLSPVISISLNTPLNESTFVCTSVNNLSVLFTTNINLIPNIEAKEKEHKKIETFTLNFNISEEEPKYEKQED